MHKYEPLETSDKIGSTKRQILGCIYTKVGYKNPFLTTFKKKKTECKTRGKKEKHKFRRVGDFHTPFITTLFFESMKDYTNGRLKFVNSEEKMGVWLKKRVNQLPLRKQNTQKLPYPMGLQ